MSAQGVRLEMAGVTTVTKKGTSVLVVLNQEDQDHHNGLDQGHGLQPQTQRVLICNLGLGTTCSKSEKLITDTRAAVSTTLRISLLLTSIFIYKVFVYLVYTCVV
jgi:hypothetical protein